MKTTSRLIAILALAGLAACDSRTASEFKQERASRQYQEAMDDYTAGRLDAAVKGFEKVLRADPANTSARFQLACLQQDSRHDNLGAFCNYHEYLQQAPDSDKAKMAKERLAICERALVEELAKKMNLIGDSAIAEEIEHSRKELADMTVEDSMVTQQIHRDIRRLIKALPQSQREVLLMRYYKNMSFKEIAERTQVSINTALGRMRYAILNMRRIADEHNIVLTV